MRTESPALPDLDDLPSPEEFAELISRLGAVEPSELRALWKRAASPRQIPHLEQLLKLSRELSRDFQGREPWERVLLAAGHEGGLAADAWIVLHGMVESAVAEWQKSRAILLAHAVIIHADTDLAALRRGLQRMAEFQARGGSLGSLTLLWRRDWKSLLAATRVNGSLPSAEVHFQALDAHLTMLESRRLLRERWSSQAEPIGLPAFADLSDPPEQVLERIAGQFKELLGWWEVWSAPLYELIESTGFDWEVHRARELTRSAPTEPFDMDAHLLGEPLQVALDARLAVAREVEAEERLSRLVRQLECDIDGAPRLRDAVRCRDVAEYRAAFENLIRLYASSTFPASPPSTA